MLPLGRFILDALVAGACAVSLMVFARAVQLRFLGSLSGAELVTARAIAGFSMAVGISYVLGAIGAFALVPLAVACGFGHRVGDERGRLRHVEPETTRASSARELGDGEQQEPISLRRCQLHAVILSVGGRAGLPPRDHVPEQFFTM